MSEGVNSMLFSSPLIYPAVCGGSLLFQPGDSQPERPIGMAPAAHGHHAGTLIMPINLLAQRARELINTRAHGVAGEQSGGCDVSDQ